MAEGSSSKLRAIIIQFKASKSKSVNEVVKVHMRRASEPVTNDPDTNEQHTEKFRLESLVDTHVSFP